MRHASWLLAVFAAAPALGQTSPAEPAPPGLEGREPPVTPRKRERYPAATRQDLAIAYLRFERALRAHPPAPDQVAAYNRRFDEASLAFFSGRFNPAVETLTAMVRELEARGEDATLRVAESLRASPSHAVVHPGNAADAVLTLEPLFALAGSANAGPSGAAEVKLAVVLLDAAGRERWRAPATTEVRDGRPGSVRIELGPLFPAMPRGDFTIALASPQGASPGFTVEKGRVSVRDGSVAARRRELEEMLLAVKPATPELTRALASARARAALLDDEVSTRNSARFLAGMDGLTEAVSAEVRAVAKGDNPYRGLAGDHWRVVAVDSAEVPCRVYAPAKVAASAAPVPLIVLFHGAGGDESMFLEGYGAGLIRELADELGFLVACPLTYSGSSNRAFDRLIEDLGGDYKVDSARVYALGHSMGAGAVSGLAAGRASAIAAACCISGGGLPAAKEGARRVPMMLIAAELDPLFGIARSRASAEAARQRGDGVEFVEAKGWGHTLVVGSHLRRAVEWMLAIRLGARP